MDGRKTRKRTVERQDLTLPIGLTAEVRRTLPNRRGFSALVAWLLVRFMTDERMQKKWAKHQTES